MADEKIIHLGSIGFSLIVSLIVFFEMWRWRYDILPTLYALAAGMLTFVVLLVIVKFVLSKIMAPNM